jgi:hypothetical protein
VADRVVDGSVRSTALFSRTAAQVAGAATKTVPSPVT